MISHYSTCGLTFQPFCTTVSWARSRRAKISRQTLSISKNSKKSKRPISVRTKCTCMAYSWINMLQTYRLATQKMTGMPLSLRIVMLRSLSNWSITSLLWPRRFTRTATPTCLSKAVKSTLNPNIGTFSCWPDVMPFESKRKKRSRKLSHRWISTLVKLLARQVSVESMKRTTRWVKRTKKRRRRRIKVSDLVKWSTSGRTYKTCWEINSKKSARSYGIKTRNFSNSAPSSIRSPWTKMSWTNSQTKSLMSSKWRFSWTRNISTKRQADRYRNEYK